HVLRVRSTAPANGTYADASFTVKVDLTAPTSTVVNNLPAIQPLTTGQPSFPVQVSWNDAAVGFVPGSGVSSVSLYVSVNGGPFTLYQTYTPSSPIASGTVQFNFVGQFNQFGFYAFHSIARDAAGNIENKSATAIDAGTFIGQAPTTTALTPA